MRAPVSTAESVRIHGILYREDPARPGVCPSDDTTGELGRLEGDTDPARDDQSFGQVRASKVTSADRREVTLSVTTPQLAGAAAICAFVSVSHGKPYDVQAIVDAVTRGLENKGNAEVRPFKVRD